MSIDASMKPAGRLRWVPWAFAGALAVVVIANLALVHFALSSWTGLVTEHAYDEGLAFNQALAEARAEAASGWQVSMRAVPRPGGADLAIVALDRQGKPIRDLAAEASWERPVGSEAIIETRLAADGEGRYRAAVALPGAGQWEVRVVLKRGAETHHLLGRVQLP